MDDLDKCLFNFINKKTKLTLGEKDIKCGELENYRLLDFFIELSIRRNEEKVDKLKIPYPFEFESHDTDCLCYLDYRLLTFNKNLSVDFKESDVAGLIHHKLFNKILTISLHE